jgi:hypothetical protein
LLKLVAIFGANGKIAIGALLLAKGDMDIQQKARGQSEQAMGPRPGKMPDKVFSARRILNGKNIGQPAGERDGLLG